MYSNKINVFTKISEYLKRPFQSEIVIIKGNYSERRFVHSKNLTKEGLTLREVCTAEKCKTIRADKRTYLWDCIKDGSCFAIRLWEFKAQFNKTFTGFASKIYAMLIFDSEYNFVGWKDKKTILATQMPNNSCYEFIEELQKLKSVAEEFDNDEFTDILNLFSHNGKGYYYANLGFSPTILFRGSDIDDIFIICEILDYYNKRNLTSQNSFFSEWILPIDAENFFWDFKPDSKLGSVCYLSKLFKSFDDFFIVFASGISKEDGANFVTAAQDRELDVFPFAILKIGSDETLELYHRDEDVLDKYFWHKVLSFRTAEDIEEHLVDNFYLVNSENELRTLLSCTDLTETILSLSHNKRNLAIIRNLI